MTLNIKFDYHTICKTILKEQLDKLGVAYTIHSLGEIKFNDNLSADHKNELRKALEPPKCPSTTNQRRHYHVGKR